MRIVVFSLATQLRSAAMNAGAAAFVSKEARDDELIGEIRRAARPRSYPTETGARGVTQDEQ